MAKRLPVILDNLGGNKVLHAPQKMLLNLQRIGVVADLSEVFRA